ncbi:MAG TPA: ribosome biogenesis GTP-binding protein YihA/YsxC [Steroidobacteraceae bacterium]|jgi:GTP-binding protein|nr:ribosome biogenesis GTP-binding protein YihA/YsxC [Steroidobacteraceae bacterium]
MSRYSKARFLKSATGPAGFGDDSGYEVAIAGRSNSGKSSALNAIVGQRDLARTSATPGRTQAVNLFELLPGRRLVDLPGYGHARVPPAVRAAWARLMEAYFSGRDSLAGLLIVVDARRGFGESDEAMLAYAAARGLPSHVLLSKCDKLARAEAKAVLAAARATLGTRAGAQLFSAETGEGVDAARAALEAMLAGHIKAPGDP